MSTLLCLLFTIVVVVGIVWVALVMYWSGQHPERHWNWSGIDLSVMSFPKDFIWGVAGAAHQIEGNCTSSNWSEWEQGNRPDGKPHILNNQTAGIACDHWNRYEEDIQLMKVLGVQACRMSLEWSKIEPRPGEYDVDAIKHYHAVLDAMHREGLQVMVTLHHFSHPIWFERMGSFEKADNIPHFVRFSEAMFLEYQSKVDFWCTVNEAEVFTVNGWFMAEFPPGKRNIKLTCKVLRNVVLAHARVYRALKRLPGGDRARIGLVKNIMQFDPYRRWFLPDWLVCRLADLVFNGAILEYLQTGIFHVWLPGLVWMQDHDPEVKGAGDFIGLNYYSHMNVAVQPNPKQPFYYREMPGDIQTDMPYPIYAEGFKRALHRINALGMPVYVTENGVSDHKDTFRETFIRRYLFAMYRAMEDGVDVRGYFYWSFVDNFEWSLGWSQKFGLYALDPETRERRLREGSKAFVDIVKRSRAG